MELNDNVIVTIVAVGAHQAHETPVPTARETSERE